MTAKTPTKSAPLTDLPALERAAECLRTLAHPHRLRIVHRVHAKLQLQLVGVPAFRADKQFVVLRLDDLPTKNLELETEVTTIALGDRVLTGCKPVAHYAVPLPMNC